MESRIEILSPKKLIGMRMSMSFADNKTGILWKNFMSRKHEVTHTAGMDLYSIQFYAAGFFSAFNTRAHFDKCAAIEVTSMEAIPEGMEYIELPAGLYVVFLYKGDARNAAAVFQYILGTWLPASPYELDIRPHFEVLGETYKKDDPDSEEEIWIPVRDKNKNQ
jgi:AraC family transcriptional regulator